MVDVNGNINKDSQTLKEELNEAKITQMAEAVLHEVLEKFNPSNAEMVVLSLVMVKMMLQRAIDSKTGYPAKMQIGTPSGHLIMLEVRKPTTDPLKQAMNMVNPNMPQSH